MTERELEQVLELIQLTPVGDKSESAKLLMRMAADSIAMDKLKTLPDTPRRRARKAQFEKPPLKGGKARNEEVGYLTFTKKESFSKGHTCLMKTLLFRCVYNRLSMNL